MEVQINVCRFPVNLKVSGQAVFFYFYSCELSVLLRWAETPPILFFRILTQVSSTYLSQCLGTVPEKDHKALCSTSSM